MKYDPNAFRLVSVDNKCRKIPPILACDIEDRTSKDGKTQEFLCAHLYGDLKRGQTIHRIDDAYTDREEFLWAIKSLRDGTKENADGTKKSEQIGCTFVGYNIGYDMKHYIGAFPSEDPFLMNGSKFISGKFANGIPVIDLFNHGGGKPLSAWFEYLNLEDEGIVKTANPQDMKLEELQEHCRADAIATYTMGEFLRNSYDDLGVGFKVTTPSVTLDLFRRKFFSGVKFFRSKFAFLNDFERQAYYGGRTEIFSRGIHKVQSYDVNSMYPACMAKYLYPNPSDSNVDYHDSDFDFKRHWDKNMLMIVACRVTAPKSRVMVLPWRTPDKSKLLFPYGKFSGVWTSVELKEAVKYGYKIEKVSSYAVYFRPQYYFREFALELYNRRLEAAEQGNEAMKQVWKLFMNSLYGKFGQQNAVSNKVTFDNPPAIDEGTRVYSTEWDGRRVFTTSSPDKEDAKHTFPCIAAFITSYARIELLQYLKKHEDDVVYCDTDSIKYPASSCAEQSSSELGAVKYESDNSGEYAFFKPKFYGKTNGNFEGIPDDYAFLEPLPARGITPFDTHGWRLKGVPVDRATTVMDWNTLTLSSAYQRPNRFSESVRRNLAANLWQEHLKDNQIEDQKRNWIGKDSEPLQAFD